MKKTLYFSALGASLLFASCKEYVDGPIPKGTTSYTDSTFIGAIETPQEKFILVDELSGVKCTNCPAGAEQLKKMGETDNLIVVALHEGALTRPIQGKSTQDFNSTVGRMLLDLVFQGVDPSKPCAAFDRQELVPPASGTKNVWFKEGYTKWADAVTEAKQKSNNKTPVNIHITTSPANERGEYGVEVHVSYTEEVTGKQILHVYLTESNIQDMQEFSGSKYETYTFNHVFRNTITPVSTGMPIADSIAIKEKGRTYVYKSKFSIDQNDAKQKYWVPSNMHVVAFVSNANDGKINVLQVQEVKLQ